MYSPDFTGIAIVSILFGIVLGIILMTAGFFIGKLWF